MQSWGNDLKIAAENPNVYAKISGLGTTSGKWDDREASLVDWTAGDLKPYVHYAIETLGADRCMCGGDWPVSVLAGGYVKAWTAYRSLLAELSPAMIDNLLRPEAYTGLAGEFVDRVTG